MGRAWTISSNAPSDSITLSSGYSIRIGSPFSYISSKLESILALCCWIYSTAHLISSDKISSFYISINKKKLDVLHDRQRDAVPQEARKRSFPRTFGPSSLPRSRKYVLHSRWQASELRSSGTFVTKGARALCAVGSGAPELRPTTSEVCVGCHFSKLSL